ncbi:MAG TPA: S53 family peptidase [Bryobacteraceae bacterium]|nr:S53 family peptidase [Bryobacteraceae bacterium]
MFQSIARFTRSIGMTAWICAAALSVPGYGQGWTSTATKGLGTALTNAVSLGPLPASTPLHIAVALRLNNRSGLENYVAAIQNPSNSQFGSSLTVDQFVASYAPTSSQVQQVSAYLSSLGFSNIQAEPNNLFVTADGTAAQAGSAFHTSIVQFDQAGRTVYANSTDAQMPASLSSTVLAVLGLTNAAVMTTPIHVQTPSTTVGVPAVHFYSPNNFWTVYDVGLTPTGSKTTIAIFAEGDLTQVIKDLRIAESENHLPQVPVQVIQVGLASTDTAGMDEWDLDTQMSTGMAGTVAKLLIYDTTSMSDSDIALMFNKFAHQNIAKAGSASFGLCETFAYLDGSMLADDQVFLEAAAQGQTVFSSTGDSGSACGVSGEANGVPLSGAAGMVEYPASSPYVIAVGGTTLLTDSNYNYLTELGWDAGGGGISAWEISPFWQTSVLPTTAAGKALPDVSLDGDLVSGALTYIDCQPGQDPVSTCQDTVGGTSLSSPLWLGVWARLESAHRNRLGFAGPSLYRLYSMPPATYVGFHDIVGGCNGFFCAIPGYDYVTGLGTPHVTALNAVVK